MCIVFTVILTKMTVYMTVLVCLLTSMAAVSAVQAEDVQPRSCLCLIRMAIIRSGWVLQ